MLYAGIDYHKRYTQVHVMDERAAPEPAHGWRTTW
jgi:hypothetical protein